MNIQQDLQFDGADNPFVSLYFFVGEKLNEDRTKTVTPWPYPEVMPEQGPVETCAIFKLEVRSSANEDAHFIVVSTYNKAGSKFQSRENLAYSKLTNAHTDDILEVAQEFVARSYWDVHLSAIKEAMVAPAPAIPPSSTPRKHFYQS